MFIYVVVDSCSLWGVIGSMTDTFDVILDVNEPEELEEAYQNHDLVDSVHPSRLTSGDVMIGSIRYERKVVSDFASSVTGTQRNVFEQVEKMLEQSEHPPYILIEGDMKDFDGLRYTNINPSALIGAVSSLTVRKGAHVLFCSDMDNLVETSISVAGKHNSEPSSSHLHSGAVDVREPFTVRCYGQLPNVGSTTAQKLAEEFESVKTLLMAGESALKDVDGIGDKRATAIYQALRGEADE